MPDIHDKYKLVLGLEIHLEPKTERKMFCGCLAYQMGAAPNSSTCPSCLGLPGALPVPNFEAVQKTQLLGLALECKLNKDAKFDRKHYFYPDLPKGYQISQYKEPFCEHGHLELDNGFKAAIKRIHLEEDTAKSFHEGDKTLIDFNMSGMPLIEIVTEPVFTSPYDASEFARKLRDIVRAIGISEADMEKGQLRIEPNISLRTAEMEIAGELPEYKVEVKNINSFKFMEKAVLFEIKRQAEILDSGGKVAQENRGWDDVKGVTVAQRSKEDAHDYRYFPEPDIPPMHFEQGYFDELQASMPELPVQIKARLSSQYGLKESVASELAKSDNFEVLRKFEEFSSQNLDPVKVANLLLNRPEFRNAGIDEMKIHLSQAESRLTSEEDLLAMIQSVLDQNAKAVEDLKNGKESSMQFLLGQIMKASKGKADPQSSSQLIKKLLS